MAMRKNLTGKIEAEKNTEQRAVALLSANISKTYIIYLDKPESWENERNRQVPTVFKSNWTLNIYLAVKMKRVKTIVETQENLLYYSQDNTALLKKNENRECLRERKDQTKPRFLLVVKYSDVKEKNLTENFNYDIDQESLYEK